MNAGLSTLRDPHMTQQELQKLTPPITIEKIDIFRDGGSIGVGLSDSTGVRYEFCIDGRISSHTLDRVYGNAFYPGMEDATMVPQGGREEGKIIALLQGYLDGKFSKEDQGRLRNAYGRRKLNEGERIAALSLNVIDRIRNPRKR